MDNKIPITVGVVGNLDVLVADIQIHKIKQVFEDINIKYPGNPVTLFSQLAPGADTIVAKIFLDIKKETKRPYNLIVPLPYNEDKYKNAQFKKEDELKIFNSLMENSEKSFVLENNTNIEENKYLYRQGGKFVADSSIILLALWDEVDTNKVGGTAETVKYKISGIFDDEVESQIFDLDGNFISILCEREKAATTGVIEFKNKCDGLSSLLNDKSIKKAIGKIVEFNNSIKNRDEKLNKPIDRLKQIRKIISTETNEQKKKYVKTINMFFFLGFFFFILFEIYKHLGLETVVFAFIFGVLAVGFFKLCRYNNSKSHHLYIENRVLSEALRVQIYWNLSDLNKNVSNYILRIHKLEYNWIKHFIQSVYGLTYDVAKTRHVELNTIKQDWIIGQKKWFEKNIKDISNKMQNIKRIIIATLILGVLGLFGIALFKYINPRMFNVSSIDEGYSHIKHLEHWCHIFIIIDSITLGLSAVLKAFLEKKGFNQILNQYKMSLSIFSATETKMDAVLADKKLNKTQKEEDLDTLLYLAGKEALIETGNWYLIMKEKDPEFGI